MLHSYDIDTLWELPPKEHRRVMRRNKRKSMSDYLSFPDRSPPEPAGNENVAEEDRV